SVCPAHVASTIMSTIDRDARRAPYLQLADIIRRRIAAGEIEVGRRIPSMTEIEAEYGLSRNTIKKAFDLLKSGWLVQAEHGGGLFVLPVPDSEAPAGKHAGGR